MDLCHLKNADLAKHIQAYKERVVLRADTVKNEEGNRAICTVQRASASRMAAARFLGTISKLLGMAEERSDPLSAYIEVKMTEAPRLLRMPEEECPEIWIRSLPRQRPKARIIQKTQWCLSQGTFLVTHWPPFSLGKKIWRRDIWEGMWENINVRIFFTGTRSSDYSHRYLCMTWKRTGRKQHMDSMWKTVQTEIDLGDPTPLIDQVYLGCT